MQSAYEDSGKCRTAAAKQEEGRTRQNSSGSDCVGNKLGLDGVNTGNKQSRGKKDCADGESTTKKGQPLLCRGINKPKSQSFNGRYTNSH